jgi:hypothetical protein
MQTSHTAVVPTAHQLLDCFRPLPYVSFTSDSHCSSRAQSSFRRRWSFTIRASPPNKLLLTVYTFGFIIYLLLLLRLIKALLLLFFENRLQFYHSRSSSKRFFFSTLFRVQQNCCCTCCYSTTQSRDGILAKEKKDPGRRFSLISLR